MSDKKDNKQTSGSTTLAKSLTAGMPNAFGDTEMAKKKQQQQEAKAKAKEEALKEKERKKLEADKIKKEKADQEKSKQESDTTGAKQKSDEATNDDDNDDGGYEEEEDESVKRKQQSSTQRRGYNRSSQITRDRKSIFGDDLDSLFQNGMLESKGTLVDTFRETVVGGVNAKKATLVTMKIMSQIQKDTSLLVKLILLPPEMWKFIGAGRKEYEEYMSKVKSLKLKTADDSKTKTILRLFNNDATNLEYLRNQFPGIGPDSAEYLTLGNLLKDNIFVEMYKELASMVLCIAIPLEDGFNLSTFHCQNLYKAFTVEEFKSIVNPRYLAILDVLGGVEAGIEEPTELIRFYTQKDFYRYSPRCWMTWINPRGILKTRDARNDSRKPRPEVLNWAFDIEGSLCSVLGVDIKGITPEIKKYKDNVITPWWSAVSEAYRKLNKKILKSKGVLDEGIINISKWDELKSNDFMVTTRLFEHYDLSDK